MSKKIVLFQGDSVTACGRDLENVESTGDGYAHLIKAHLAYESPENYQIYNRGVSGNRIVDVYARIKADVINLKPDVLSILIGVNDVWHEFLTHNGVSADKFEKIYCTMIEEIKEELPEVKIIILEPFAVRGTATDGYEGMWEEFALEMKKRAEKAKKVAEKYHLPYVTLQDKFDNVTAKTDSNYWFRDGVHPMPQGHELIKRAWLEAFMKL